MGTIKDRNSMDLTEAEDTKKRWQEYTEGRDKKDLLDSICQQIWKTQQWPQDWKRSVFIPIPSKGNAEEFSNYYIIALILYTSKVILKSLQATVQQC